MAKKQSTSGEEKLFHERELISKLLEYAAGYEITDILRLVVDRIPHLIGAREASLFWLDRENNRILLRETYLGNRHKIGKHDYKIGEGLTGWVAKTGRPLRIRNITDENELKSIDPELHWADKHEGYRSASKEEQEHQRTFLAVPIKIDGITMGVLRIAKTEKRNAWFLREHEALLITFAVHLATIIKNRELLERADDFKTLIEPMFFNSPGAMDQYFKYASNVIPTILNSRGCTIFLKDETTGAYVLRYTSRGNPLENEIGRAYYNEGEGLTGWVLRTGESLLINDIQDEDELKHIHPALKWMGKYKEFLVHHSNFLAAPIRTAKEIYGVIRLSKGGEDTPFSEGDESLLIMYGNFLGSSLQSLQFEQAGTLMVKPKWEGRYPVIKKCSYVLMPFSKPWSNNVKNAVRRAVESQDLIFRIADEESGPVVIKDIWRGICEARIIIADLSTGNPNVAYEVGLSDVLGKEMVLLAQNPNEVPFDFAGARLLVYDVDHIDEFQEKLGQRIKQLLSSSRSAN